MPASCSKCDDMCEVPELSVKISTSVKTSLISSDVMIKCLAACMDIICILCLGCTIYRIINIQMTREAVLLAV